MSSKRSWWGKGDSFALNHYQVYGFPFPLPWLGFAPYVGEVESDAVGTILWTRFGRALQKQKHKLIKTRSPNLALIQWQSQNWHENCCILSEGLPGLFIISIMYNYINTLLRRFKERIRTWVDRRNNLHNYL